MNLILGDNSGTPPTGNTVPLYASWSGGVQVGEYPSDVFLPDSDSLITKFSQLDGPGVNQQPANAYRAGWIRWDMLDLNQYDTQSGEMIYDLRQRLYTVTNSTYYLGASVSTGAFPFDTNPIEVQLDRFELKFVPNSADRKLYNVILHFTAYP